MAERIIAGQQLQRVVDVLTSTASMLNSARLIMNDDVSRKLAENAVESARAALVLLRELPFAHSVPVVRVGEHNGGDYDMRHRPAQERALTQTIGERDRYCEWADKLADAIAEHFGIEIGEHSAGFEANNPWASALEHIENAPRPAGAHEVPPHDPLRQAAEQFLASCKDGNVRELVDYYEAIFSEALSSTPAQGDGGTGGVPASDGGQKNG